jgi:hypothetical protein
MAQVTLGKFFSGVPKFDGERANHVTENELKFHVECSLKKTRLPVISFNYFCSSSFNEIKQNGVKYTIHTTRCLVKIRRDFQH